MKRTIYIILGVALYTSGLFTQKYLTKTPVLTCPPATPCPPCPPAVEVQSLNLGELKKLKGGFTFAPVFNGTVLMYPSKEEEKELVSTAKDPKMKKR